MIGPWGPWGGGWIFTLRSMGKYCVIHISETRGAIDTKFAGYIHPVLPEVFSAFGVAWSKGVPARGVEHFLGWGYSFSWIGQLPFVFAWASSNVVQYLGDRLAHVLMPNFFLIGQGVSTRWPKKYDNLYFFDNFWSLLPCISESLCADILCRFWQKRQRISAHKEYQK